MPKHRWMGIALVFFQISILIILCYAFNFTFYNFPNWSVNGYTGSHLYQYQVDALLKGHLALSDSLKFIYHDTAWHNGVQLTFGIGAALLRLPLQILVMSFAPSSWPDKFYVVFYLVCIFIFGVSVLHRYFQINKFALSSLLGCFFAIPVFSNLLFVRFECYEEACVYSNLMGIFSALLAIDLVGKNSIKKFLFFSIVSGSLVLFRPTGVFVGLAIYGTYLAMEGRKKHSRMVLSWGCMAFALTVSSQLLVNFLRFGSPLEFGHGLVVNSSGLNSFALKFDNFYAHVDIFSAMVELFSSIFLNPSLNGSFFYLKGFFVGQAPSLRFHEFYFQTFGLFDLFFFLAAWFLPFSKFISRNKKYPLNSLLIIRLLSLGSASIFILFLMFYAKVPGISSRYISDLVPSYFMAVLSLAIMIFESADRFEKRLVRQGSFLVFLFSLLLICFSGVDVLQLNGPGSNHHDDYGKNIHLRSEADAGKSDKMRSLAFEAPPQSYTCPDSSRQTMSAFFAEMPLNGSGWGYGSCKVGHFVILYFEYKKCLEVEYTLDSLEWLSKFPARVKSGPFELKAQSELQVRGGSLFQTYCQLEKAKWDSAYGAVFFGFVNPQRLLSSAQVRMKSVKMFDP